MYLTEMFLPTRSQVMHIFDQVWKMDHHRDKKQTKNKTHPSPLADAAFKCYLSNKLAVRKSLNFQMYSLICKLFFIFCLPIIFAGIHKKKIDEK